MIERQANKPEIAAQKRTIKLAPSIGDWTTYKPPKILVKKVKSGLYGFDRLSKDELNLVLLIHYRFIQKLCKRFKIDLKMAVELFSVQEIQTTYLNYLRSLTGPVVQAKITITGLHDTVSVFFSLPLANSTINYALGSQDMEHANRGLTEAEKITFNTTLNECMADYAAAFENVIEAPALSVTNSPDIAIDASINTTSTFVCFNAEVAFGENPPGRISIGYQGSSIKTLLAKYKQKDMEKPLDFSVLPPALLAEIKIPLKVNMGTSTLSTNEISQLEVGDVVTLNTSIDSPFSLSVAKVLKFLCQPGIKEKKSSVRITTFRERGEEQVPPPNLAIETKQKENTKKNEIKELVKTMAPPTKISPVQGKEIPLEAEDDDDFLDEFPEDEFPEDDLLEDDL